MNAFDGYDLAQDFGKAKRPLHISFDSDYLYFRMYFMDDCNYVLSRS